MRGLVLVMCLGAFVVANAKVIQVDDASFSKVVGSDANAIYAVEFYAPWCGHCKSLEPEYKKFADAVTPFVQVVAIDADANRNVGSKYEVKGFPTIKFFVGKDTPVDYNGARTAAALTEFAQGLIKKTITKRLSGGSSSSSSSSGGSSGGSKKSGGGSAGPSAVVELSDDVFEAQVLQSDDLWLVEFFAPWCGHCQRLAPEWADAAKQLDGEVKLGAVDATVHSQYATKYGVKGYPTIKVIHGGKVEDYNGGRTASDIVQYAQDKLSKLGGASDVLLELVDELIFTKKCASKAGLLCVVAFLPHILDDQAAERNKRLEVISQVATKMKGRPFKFFWAQGGDQQGLEEQLQLGFGFPAVVAISPSKNRFATMTAAFDAGGLTSFLDGVLAGKVRYGAINKPLKIVQATPWDGKDATPPE